MPNNAILMSRTTHLSIEVITIIKSFREAQSRLSEHKDLLDNMTDAVDWTIIEAQYGLPTGKGETFYNLIAGAKAELSADTNFNSLIDWVVPTAA